MVTLEKLLRQATADTTASIPLRPNRVHPLSRKDYNNNVGIHAPTVDYSFEPDARDNTAASVYRLVRSGGPRVLDLGSGPGIVAAYLTEHDGKVVTCVDQSPEALAAACIGQSRRIWRAPRGLIS